MTELSAEDSQPQVEPLQPDLIPEEMIERVKTGQDSSMRLKTGLLITFEGGEGSGKTTQSTRLAGRLEDLGIDVLHAREPGGTRLGEEIRSWVKREAGITAVAETLLFAAARAQLVAEAIRPNLEGGSIVILDRFTDSTLAYQGYGRGLDIEQVRAINKVATSGLEPDLTVFLDAEPKEMLSRVQTTPDLFENGKKRQPTRTGDRPDERRFEKEPLSFHRKVRKGYLELSKDGSRWSVINADQAQHRIADAIWKRVRPLLVERGVDEVLLKRKQGHKSE